MSLDKLIGSLCNSLEAEKELPVLKFTNIQANEIYQEYEDIFNAFKRGIKFPQIIIQNFDDANVKASIYTLQLCGYSDESIIKLQMDRSLQRRYELLNNDLIFSQLYNNCKKEFIKNGLKIKQF